MIIIIMLNFKKYSHCIIYNLHLSSPQALHCKLFSCPCFPVMADSCTIPAHLYYSLLMKLTRLIKITFNYRLQTCYQAVEWLKQTMILQERHNTWICKKSLRISSFQFAYRFVPPWQTFKTGLGRAWSMAVAKPFSQWFTYVTSSLCFFLFQELKKFKQCSLREFQLIFLSGALASRFHLRAFASTRARIRASRRYVSRFHAHCTD